MDRTFRVGEAIGRPTEPLIARCDSCGVHYPYEMTRDLRVDGLPDCGLRVCDNCRLGAVVREKQAYVWRHLPAYVR